MTADATLPASDDLTPEMLGWWEELAEAASEIELWEEYLWPHQPVMSMRDGSIAGCQCLDNVFTKHEDWGTHLTSVVMSQLAELPTAVSDLLSGVRSRDARIAEMEAVIVGAPHADACRRQNPFFNPNDPAPCDCWKSKAPSADLARAKAEAWDACLDAIEQNELNTEQARVGNPYLAGADR